MPALLGKGTSFTGRSRPRSNCPAVRSFSTSRSDCVVALLPGNHDYYGGYGNLWKELQELAPDFATPAHRYRSLPAARLQD